MAVVIQQPDALAPLESAAEGYTQGKDKAMALALAKEKQAADERNQTRALDLQQSQVESENKSRDASTAIAKEQHAYEVSIRPMLERLTNLQITGQLTQNDVLQETLAAQKIDTETKAKLAKLGIPEKQAEAALAEVRQRLQTDIAQQHSAEAAQRASEQQTNASKQLLPGEIAQQGATREATLAGAAASRHAAAAPYSTGGTSGAYEGGLTEYTSLSPQGRAIVDDVASGKITAREGALRATKIPAEKQKIIDALAKVGEDPKAKAGVDPIVQKVINAMANTPAPQRLQVLTTSKTFNDATPDQQAAMLKGVKALP